MPLPASCKKGGESMTGGFTFCGVDISTIGLEYAPELEDTYVYSPAKPRVHEETFDGHNGGYFYGISREPKEFVLRCFFEETEIDRGIMAKIMNLFREGRSGKLVFERRPWCYYRATVTNLDTTGITNYLNGIVTITMKAYYPYGQSDVMAVQRTSKDYYRIMANTAFFPDETMIPQIAFCQKRPMTEATEILLANPGNEYAPLGIEIAGDVGDGVVITNHTTNQVCKFVAMSESEFDGEKNFVYLDGASGKCTSVKNTTTKIAFLYHDLGFITLAPAFPAKRDLRIVTQDDMVYSVSKLYDRNRGETREGLEDELKGHYLWLNNGWHEITGIGQDLDDTDPNFLTVAARNEHHIQLKDKVPNGISENTMAFKMNRLTVEPVSTMNLTRLKFIYKPTFS